MFDEENYDGQIKENEIKVNNASIVDGETTFATLCHKLRDHIKHNHTMFFKFIIALIILCFL